MNTYSLSALALLAAVVTLLPSLEHAQGTGLGQLDGLKSQFLPAAYRKANFSMDDLKRIYREKCKKVGGADNATLYQDIEKGAAVLTVCLSKFVNLTAVQTEIDVARPIGELDTVFHKYCIKAPEAEHCIREFNAKLQPCLTKAERQQNEALLRIASTLVGFMCANGGNQIALFVAEQGPECMEANKEAIANCMNSSFAQYMPKDGTVPDLYNLPELVLAPKHCLDLERFEACTLHHLEQCREITPANVVQSMFKFVNNETSCASHRARTPPSVLKAATDIGGGAAHGAFFSVILLSLSGLLLWQFS